MCILIAGKCALHQRKPSVLRCSLSVWTRIISRFHLLEWVQLCSPVPFICNCGFTQANLRQFLIYIFGMLCYKSLSKSQVYIYFLHEILFYFLKANCNIKILSSRGCLLFIQFFQWVSYCLLYIHQFFVLWTILSYELYSLSLTLDCGVSPLFMFTFGNNLIENLCIQTWYIITALWGCLYLNY